MTNRNLLTAVATRCLAGLFGLLAATPVQAQTPASFIPIPATASTRGGSIIGTRNIPTIYGSNVTATVDGVSTAIVHATFDAYWLVAPPHPAGPAAVQVAATGGGTTSYFNATITYVELPQVGLASPISIVSRATDGSPSTGRSDRIGSGLASSSADGRFVLFRSDSGFAGLPGNTRQDLYRKDTESGVLQRVFACGVECQSAAISADGSRVVARHTYLSGSTFLNAIMVADAPFTGTLSRVDVAGDGLPPASGAPGEATLSGNGRFVVFTSSANLDAIPADGPSSQDLFVRDLSLGETERWTTGVNVVPLGGFSASADGRLIVFTTAAAILSDDVNGQNDVYLLDRLAGVFVRLATHADAPPSVSAIAADGRTVVFQSAASNLVADDSNGVADVFVLDTESRAISRVSVASDGRQTSAAALFAGRTGVSANGRRIAFRSNATQLVTTPLPAGLSGNYVHDRTTGRTMLVSADADGWATPSASTAAVTPAGRGVTFSSRSQDLVLDDTNLADDVFLKALPPDTPAGNDVPAVPVDPVTGDTPVELTYAAVTVPGDTSVTYTDTAPPLPSGFQLGSRFVDIETTAIFSGSVTVCVEYDPATTPDPAALRLFHYEGDAWVDITTSLDQDARVVCGATMSLSPFVLAIPPQPAFAVRSSLDPGRVFKTGSTVPIRVQVLDGTGANVSAQDLPLVATGLRQVSTQTDWTTPEDPGHSNPDLAFAFTDVDGEPGYRFNLKTTGLTPGTYALQFRVGDTESQLSVEFQVR